MNLLVKVSCSDSKYWSFDESSIRYCVPFVKIRCENCFVYHYDRVGLDKKRVYNLKMKKRMFKILDSPGMFIK
jgi:hypothetical protein